jgi:hypothetical protein
MKWSGCLWLMPCGILRTALRACSVRFSPHLPPGRVARRPHAPEDCCRHGKQLDPPETTLSTICSCSGRVENAPTWHSVMQHHAQIPILLRNSDTEHATRLHSTSLSTQLQLVRPWHLVRSRQGYVALMSALGLTRRVKVSAAFQARFSQSRRLIDILVAVWW